jgi:hypothetical protein
VNHVEYTLGLTRFNFKEVNAYQATSLSVRDRLIEQLNDSNEYFNVRKTLYLIIFTVPKLQARVLYVTGVPPWSHALELTGEYRHGTEVQGRYDGDWN